MIIRTTSPLTLVLTTFILVACGPGDDGRDGPNGPPAPKPTMLYCPPTFFELMGDLPGCDTTSEAQDISVDGRFVVGVGSSDEPGVGDCLGGAHSYIAVGWTRACGKRPFLNTPAAMILGRPGIIGLGYLPNDQEESAALGISPDARICTGWSTYKPGSRIARPVLFDRRKNRITLDPLQGIIGGSANDASERFTGLPEPEGTGLPPGIVRVDERLRLLSERVVVGYSNEDGQHPSRTERSRAVYWGPPIGQAHALPLPVAVPGFPQLDQVRSSEAVGVSDEGTVIVGNLYHGNSGGPFTSLPCAWVWDATGHYSPVPLATLAGFGETATALHLSGDGKMIVGSSRDADGDMACVWFQQQNGSTITWSAPQPLGRFSGMSYSVAQGTDYFGSMVVGGSGNYDEVTEKFTEHAVLWQRERKADGSWGPFGSPQDLLDLFHARGVAKKYDDHWQAEARCISEFDNVIGGIIYDPARPDWPLGWVGALP